MIKSKEDYLFYLESDRRALGHTRRRPRLFLDHTWRYQRLLRKVEYYVNCKKFPAYTLLLRFLLLRMSIRLGYSIPINAFGPGLSIAHIGPIIVNDGAKIGRNCRIHVGVNIGTAAGHSNKAPSIGNNVYIGPGAKLFGNIQIADGIAIGANAVVNKSFYEPDITIAGIPAKKISDKGLKGI